MDDIFLEEDEEDWRDWCMTRVSWEDWDKETEMVDAVVIPSTPNNVKAIKTFFELGGGRKIEMAELKALSIDERNELGRLSAAELNRLNISF